MKVRAFAVLNHRRATQRGLSLLWGGLPQRDSGGSCRRLSGQGQGGEVPGEERGEETQRTEGEIDRRAVKQSSRNVATEAEEEERGGGRDGMMKRGGASTTEAQAAAEFDAKLFEGSLATTSIGRCLIYLQETESTMDLAQQEMMNGGQSGTLILAEAQTKGRGRRGRAWASGHGENLAFTLILHLDDFAELFKVNFATAIAVVLACLDEDKDIQAKIKWPNDVWINGKKLCGILVDTSIQGKDTWAAVGVGVNVNQRISSLAEVEDKELQTTATSLRDVLGRNVQREVFLARYCNHMERLMSLSLPQIIEEYQRHDMLCGNTVLVMPKGKEDPLRVEAVALGFTETGSLRVRIVESGEEKELYAEEVSVRPTQPQQHNAL